MELLGEGSSTVDRAFGEALAVAIHRDPSIADDLHPLDLKPLNLNPDRVFQAFVKRSAEIGASNPFLHKIRSARVGVSLEVIRTDLARDLESARQGLNRYEPFETVLDKLSRKGRIQVLTTQIRELEDLTDLSSIETYAKTARARVNEGLEKMAKQTEDFSASIKDLDASLESSMPSAILILGFQAYVDTWGRLAANLESIIK